MTATTLLLIEDEAENAAIIRSVLESDGHVVAWSDTGRKGLTEAGLKPYDLIVLDRMLPDLSGMEIVQRLREAGIETPVLMLSALSRSENRSEGLEAGADDYLGKPFEGHELTARVRALLRRSKSRLHSAIMLYGDIELHVKSRTANRQGVHLALSPKEFDILKLLMEHAGDIVTRDMLLKEVWNLNFDPQTNVIDVNMSRLRHRLEDDFDLPCLETVRGAGFRLICHPTESENHSG